MLRIAIQSKGRLYEESMALLEEAGIKIPGGKRTLLVPARNFPVEVLFLRDDDIPESVASGVADVGIVGLNEVMEKRCPVGILKKLGFGKCRLSLAIPQNIDYQDRNWFSGKKIATSYPGILSDYLHKNGIVSDIHVITGSVDIGTDSISPEKRGILDELLFRFDSVQAADDKKYILMNVPQKKLNDVLSVLPGIKSPTVMPLADKEWCSVHTVLDEKCFWEIINRLKTAGAEGILVLDIEKMIL